MNSKILYSIIALILVGGLFSVVYAGPIITMITFAGNTHTTGDADIDGDLNVDGTITGSETLEGLGCSTNQIARFDGSNWVCGTQSAKLNPVFTIDSTGNVGQYNSLAIGSDDLPIISYYDGSIGDLKVVHCTNTVCSTFDTPTTVDSTGIAGFYTSIAIGTDGFPIVSYFDRSNTALKVVHCTNTLCSTFDTPTTVDSPGSVGAHTSIAIGTDGFPIISYYDNEDANLKVAHCGSLTCTAPSLETVASTFEVGTDTSITIGTDGFPIISYRDNLNTALKVSHCTNITCSTFDTPIFVDGLGIGNVGLFTSIAIGTDGFPIISYYDSLNTNLKVAHCGSLTCTTSSLETFDASGNVGQYNSLAIGSDDLPIISYFDATNLNLKTIVNGIALIFS